MQRIPKNSLLLVWAAVLGACAEPLHVRAPETMSPLRLVLPEGSSLTASSIAKSPSVALSSADRADRMAAIGPTSSAYEDLTGFEPQFRRKSTKARFNPGSTTLAMVEGFVEYWGNQGQQRITFDLSKDGTSLVYRTEIFDHAELFPGWHVMHDFARVPLVATCGHKLLGHTNHQAWWRPSYDASQVVSVSDVSYSNLAEQDSCQPARKDEESAPAGGGSNDGHQTDDWYLCTWEVWYDRYGTEISRTLLYCVPM
ncbi:MAG TPA: hypothetical protein PLX31_05685 [Gemmatimonadaceae bacterium]|jgi:hypothetical protein|nr:hypothetical protein [Gemmatimonadaceae bacterium]HPV74361.1 hypothetical protein [Gemmatimonadaceae bacterium]